MGVSDGRKRGSKVGKEERERERRGGGRKEGREKKNT